MRRKEGLRREGRWAVAAYARNRAAVIGERCRICGVSRGIGRGGTFAKSARHVWTDPRWHWRFGSTLRRIRTAEGDWKVVGSQTLAGVPFESFLNVPERESEHHKVNNKCMCFLFLVIHGKPA